jgi:FKBP-type peptidyl-prolyl cis-trans isomerase
MKWLWTLVIVLILSGFGIVISGEGKDSPQEELKTVTEKTSYALGMEIGSYLKDLPIEINVATFIQGIEDTFKGAKLRLTEKEADQVKLELRKTIESANAGKQQVGAENNKKEGQMFLEENKTKKGVITTASGLQYMVLTAGTGTKPKATDMVCVHYRGTLINGTEFDSSYKRGEPATFPLNRVIPGWTEALQLMPVGSKYRLFIPSNLAYGERGSGKLIGPNSTLIFEVELLEIKE